jgi:hypothetical protein
MKPDKIKKILLFETAVLILLIIGAFLFFNFYYHTESFSVNPDYPIQSTIIGGDKATTTVKITNYDKQWQDYNASILGLDGTSSVSEKKFTLAPRESKILTLSFNGSDTTKGVYVGKLEIKNPIYKKEIPIVLNFREEINAFAVIQKPVPKYEQVYLGDKMGVDIKIFDLVQDTPKEFLVKYSIKNFDNDLLYSSDESIFVDKSYEFSKLFDIDEKSFALNKYYVFTTSISYKNETIYTPYLFLVEKKPSSLFTGNSNLFFIIILGFVIVILVLFFYFIRVREDVLFKLRKQQNNELQRNLKLIIDSQRELKKLHINDEENKLKKLEKLKNTVSARIRKKQKKQQEEIKKLKKSGKKKSDVEKKLNEWKNEGYRMFETGNEIKKVSKKVMDSQIDKWKKQGYDTDSMFR